MRVLNKLCCFIRMFNIFLKLKEIYKNLDHPTKIKVKITFKEFMKKIEYIFNRFFTNMK